MKLLRTAALTSLFLALTSVLVAAEPLKSGPQVGEKVPGPFEPLNINGSKAGQKNCLYCSNGSNPVAMVFVREVSEPVTKLIKKIDAETAKNSDCKMGSFFVFLSDDESTERKLKEIVKNAELKQTVLATDVKTGPEKYNVSPDADVTVVLYTDRTVKKNFTFPKGKMTDKDIDAVIAGISEILPKK
jgi:hypothetical protein